MRNVELSVVVMQPSAPNADLSESEDRIVTAVLKQLSGPLHLMIQGQMTQISTSLEQRVNQFVKAAVDSHMSNIGQVVHDAVERVLRGSSASGNSGVTGSSADGVPEG